MGMHAGQWLHQDADDACMMRAPQARMHDCMLCTCMTCMHRSGVLMYLTMLSREAHAQGRGVVWPLEALAAVAAGDPPCLV